MVEGDAPLLLPLFQLLLTMAIEEFDLTWQYKRCYFDNIFINYETQLEYLRVCWIHRLQTHGSAKEKKVNGCHSHRAVTSNWSRLVVNIMRHAWVIFIISCASNNNMGSTSSAFSQPQIPHPYAVALTFYKSMLRSCNKWTLNAKLRNEKCVWIERNEIPFQ